MTSGEHRRLRGTCQQRMGVTRRSVRSSDRIRASFLKNLCVRRPSRVIFTGVIPDTSSGISRISKSVLQSDRVRHGFQVKLGVTEVEARRLDTLMDEVERMLLAV